MSIDWTHLLPVAFLALMGAAMLAYVVLDGYDLGVGMLMHHADPAQQDMMVASIGPFWDANETWLVLGVGVLLIAFPKAHGLVLGALYLPVALMLVGLVLRGVAFEFRAKDAARQRLWTQVFMAGSFAASAAQGWMLGRYVTGLAEGWGATLFAAAIAVALPAAYAMLGACWLVLKTDGALQQAARGWALRAWWPLVLGLVAVSLATPVVSATVRERWFAMPEFIALLPIPLATATALLGLRWLLQQPQVLGRWCALPMAAVVAVFLLGGLGLAYSLYPYVVMDRLTVWQAASSPEALAVIAVGCCLAVPAIVGYSVFAYRVFGGKARPLSYA